jgi:GT2 family glycosyltransferase
MGAGPAQPGTAFSVVVPVYRQWDLVPDLLVALAAQDLALHAAEVILVDDAPGEKRPALTLPPGIRVVPGPGRGSYAARNAGVEEARGAWLLFTDADCRPRPGWLAAYAAAAVPETLLAGPVRMIGSDRPGPCEVFDLVRGIPQERYVRHGYAATANLAVPAAAFRALGGFDAARRSGGDAEFCRRAMRAGHGLRFVPEAGVDHLARATWGELTRKARRVKGGQVGAGPTSRRLTWAVRSLAPPVREMAHFLAAPHGLGRRVTACAVRMRLWGVELEEVARLLAGGKPER